MEIKRGIPVCPGVAIGPALILDAEGFRIPRVSIPSDQVEAEVRRFADALERASEAAREKSRTLAARLGADIGNIFYGQALLFAQDPLIRQEVEQFIRAEHFNAEYAVSLRWTASGIGRHSSQSRAAASGQGTRQQRRSRR